MNVCFIVPQVMKTVEGGLYVQVSNTAHALKQKGITVTQFNPWETYDFKLFDCAHLFRADPETYNITKLFNELHIPIVTSTVFYNTHKLIYVRWFRRLTRFIRKFFSGVRSDLDYVADVCKFSSRVLPNTNAEKEFIVKGLGIPSKNTLVVPNAVEERFADADPNLFYEKYSKNDFILSVANFGYPRKNMLNLINALERIDHQAVLIGSIYNNDYGIKCQNKLKQSNNILWLDALSHNDPMLASAYAACKVFVLPSLYETPGLSAMEAALAEANIVITPHGGPKEYFKDMVEYIEPKSVSSIEEKLRLALLKKPDPKLKKHILERYTYRAVADKLEQIYRDVIIK